MGETPTTAEIAELEAAVAEALTTGNESALSILGFGEVSVALGWPTVEPRFVCKRTPPFSKAEFEAYRSVVLDYIAALRAAGLAVPDTTVSSVDRSTDVIAYLVQPKLDADTLGHNILRANQPDPDHPLLTAVAESLRIVSPTLSIDAQFTNFSWDGTQLSLIDVGTPFLWNDSGAYLMDMAPFARMLPAPTRRLAIRELTKLANRWTDPQRVGLDIVANLYREGLDDWVDPTLIALNRRIDDQTPLTADAARAFYDEDLKTWPTLKKLQRVERWWQTSVRRRPYDWFIRSTFVEAGPKEVRS